MELFWDFGNLSLMCISSAFFRGCMGSIFCGGSEFLRGSHIFLDICVSRMLPTEIFSM